MLIFAIVSMHYLRQFSIQVQNIDVCTVNLSVSHSVMWAGLWERLFGVKVRVFVVQ